MVLNVLFFSFLTQVHLSLQPQTNTLSYIFIYSKATATGVKHRRRALILARAAILGAGQVETKITTTCSLPSVHVNEDARQHVFHIQGVADIYNPEIQNLEIVVLSHSGSELDANGTETPKLVLCSCVSRHKHSIVSGMECQNRIEQSRILNCDEKSPISCLVFMASG